MIYEFSVLIATYYKDNSKCFADAIKSVLNQTYLPSEIVIVEDGPLTEALYERINFYKISHAALFKIITLKENLGLGNALDIGLKNCSNELVARMDSDDIAVENRFEIQINYFLKNPETAVLGGYMQEFSIVNNQKVFLQKKLAPLGTNYIKSYAQMRNPINHPTVMFKKSIIEKVGSYKEISLFEDYYLWLRLLKCGFEINNVSDTLLFFRVGSSLVERRHGWQYLIKEFEFIILCYKENLISFKALAVQCITRLPLRVLPKSVLQVFYKTMLRKK